MGIERLGNTEEIRIQDISTEVKRGENFEFGELLEEGDWQRFKGYLEIWLQEIKDVPIITARTAKNITEYCFNLYLLDPKKFEKEIILDDSLLEKVKNGLAEERTFDLSIRARGMFRVAFPESYQEDTLYLEDATEYVRTLRFRPEEVAACAMFLRILSAEQFKKSEFKFVFNQTYKEKLEFFNRPDTVLFDALFTMLLPTKFFNPVDAQPYRWQEKDLRGLVEHFRVQESVPTLLKSLAACKVIMASRFELEEDKLKIVMGQEKTEFNAETPEMPLERNY